MHQSSAGCGRHRGKRDPTPGGPTSHDDGCYLKGRPGRPFKCAEVVARDGDLAARPKGWRSDTSVGATAILPQRSWDAAARDKTPSPAKPKTRRAFKALVTVAFTALLRRVEPFQGGEHLKQRNRFHRTQKPS